MYSTTTSRRRGYVAAGAAAAALALMPSAVASGAGMLPPVLDAKVSIGGFHGAATSATVTAGAVVKTYRYATADSYQNLDAYYNDAWVGGSARAAVVVIHGGSWANGDKASSSSVSAKLYGEGFAVFNINYRLTAPLGSHVGTPWPAQRIDTELAVRWIKANASKFGVDPARIALYGFSSGGHVALSAAGYYRGVRAVVSVSGVLQPHRVMNIAVSGSSGVDVRTQAVVVLSQWASLAVQCPYLAWVECGRRWSTFKPETYFSRLSPPFYAIMGAADPVVPPGTMTAIDYWADRAGLPHVTIMVANAGHSEAVLTGDQGRWRAMVTWLKARTA